MTHMSDTSSERRIHSGASDLGGSAELTNIAGKAGATGTGAAGAK